MRHQASLLLVAIMAITLTLPAVAAEHGGHGMHQMHGSGHGQGHGRHHGDDGWKSTLTAEQSAQIDKLKLEYKKQAYPIKAKIKHAKVELALLISSDSPNQKDIDKKIEEIAKLKAEKMRVKSTHKIKVRKVLNDEQRVQFDLKLLKKAYSDKKGKH